MGRLGPIVGKHFGKPAMTYTVWMHPVPAQPTDHIELQYANSYGQPETATSGLYQHPWSQHDYMGLAAELEIMRVAGDGLLVRLSVYSWSVWPEGASPNCFERYSGCQADLWESPEFCNFWDAEEFAQFAWRRWRDTGRPAASGMTRRDDLDCLFNPVPLAVAVA